MPQSMFTQQNEVWTINCLLGRDGDVEIEDDDFEEILPEDEEGGEESGEAREVQADIFRKEEENLAVSECF